MCSLHMVCVRYVCIYIYTPIYMYLCYYVSYVYDMHVMRAMYAMHVTCATCVTCNGKHIMCAL